MRGGPRVGNRHERQALRAFPRRDLKVPDANNQGRADVQVRGGILPDMWSVRCAVVRRRLERHADGALAPRATRLVTSHLPGCPTCRTAFEKLTRLRTLRSEERRVGKECRCRWAEGQ